MKCNCIEDSEKKLSEMTGDPESRLATGFVIVGDQMERVLNIPFNYRKKTSKGEFCKGKTQAYVTPTYCPFCGKKIVDDKKEES